MGAKLQPVYSEMYEEANSQESLHLNVPAHDVPKFLQVLSSEIPVIPVASLDILIDSVQV